MAKSIEGARFHHVWIDEIETFGVAVDPKDIARASIDAFAAEMRATASPDVVEMLERRGYFMTPPRRTIKGEFILDEDVTLFDIDGTITAGIDPARTDEFIDTIAPLEDL